MCYLLFSLLPNIQLLISKKEIAFCIHDCRKSFFTEDLAADTFRNIRNPILQNKSFRAELTTYLPTA
jgi:hypothetical protein